MTAVNRWAEFQADFPDDQIEENGDIVRVGGKAIAEAIADMLRGFGSEVEHLYDDGIRGWMCDFTYEGLALHFQIVDLGDESLLIFEEPHRATRKVSRYGDALMKLNDALRQDGRFHKLIWYRYDGRHPRDNPSQIPVVVELATADASERNGMIIEKSDFIGKLLAPLRRRSGR